MAADRTKQSATQRPTYSTSDAPTSDAPRIIYRPREDATPEGELAALAAVYAFILERHKAKDIVPKSGDEENRTETGRAVEPSRESFAGEGSA